MMLSSSKRGCINHPDNFCYVCGEYTPPAHRVKLNSRIRYAYNHYFACQVGDQDKKWTPHICCNRCRTSLLFWLDGKRKQMPFVVPIVWREQSDHVTDCYFCMTNIKEFSRKHKFLTPYAGQPLNPFPMTQICLYLILPLKRKIPCLLMKVRVPVLKVRKILLNQIHLFNMSLPTFHQSGTPK